MKLKLIYESVISNNDVYYFGTNSRNIDFTGTGYITDGTFFSSDYDVAAGYGKYVFEVRFNSDLRVFDSLDDVQVQELLDAVGELYDTYYSEDDDEYYVRTVDMVVSHSDTWELIENTPSAISYLKRNYDAVRIIEGGSADNLLVFYPVHSKIQSFKLIRK